MNHDEARRFFLKPSSYFSQNLPVYFNITYLLESALEKLGEESLETKNHLFENHKYSKCPNIIIPFT